ncbi:hypothetical protein WG8_2139 [Paenibacillus sp. Aloe-11]|nr:hypothetical protein WG8_2139 [Paenibacillus sp. Aloe-11]
MSEHRAVNDKEGSKRIEAPCPYTAQIVTGQRTQLKDAAV